MFYGLAEFLAVFLSREGTASGSASLEQGGIFSAESLDLFSGFGEVDVLSGLFGQYLRHADRSGGLFDFAVESFFQVEQFIKAGVGEHAADHYLLVV